MASMDKHPLENVGPGKPIVPAHPGFVSTPLRVKWRGGEPLHATLGTSWGRTWLRRLGPACSGVVFFYSVMVLMQVAWMGTIGVRCLFGTDVEEEVPADFQWSPTSDVRRGASDGSAARTAEAVDRPQIGDKLLSIGPIVLKEGSYSDYIQALRGLSDQVGRTVKVTWSDSRSEQIHAAQAVVRYPPTRSYVLSCVWFLQELLIFGVGARVFWKRPGDVSARLFFVLCLVTVGAYMGGYHWTEIVVCRALIYPFVFFALLVPVVNLHFFLIFPRQNPVFLRHRRLVLIVLYGIPVVFLAAIWGSMYMSHWFRLYDTGVRTTAAERVIRGLALCYIAIATLIFSLCIPCLVFSYRRARTWAEKNQVKWILLASLIASVLIGYLLWQAW